MNFPIVQEKSMSFLSQNKISLRNKKKGGLIWDIPMVHMVTVMLVVPIQDRIQDPYRIMAEVLVGASP